MDYHLQNKKLDLTYFHGELSFELALHIPYINYLVKNSLVNSTCGPVGTSPFYFFSPTHKEIPVHRKFEACIHAFPFGPDKDQRVFKLKRPDLWCPPDYKTHFKNDDLVFDKPLLIIHNKYNIEHGAITRNHINLVVLEKLFIMLQDKYQVVYIRPMGNEKGYSNDCNILEFEDHNLVKKYPKIILYQDLLHKYPQYNYNELQLKLHANCKRFITQQSGNNILCCYFGGVNIVLEHINDKLAGPRFPLSTRDPRGSAYNGYLRDISNQNIVHAKNINELLEYSKNYF